MDRKWPVYNVDFKKKMGQNYRRKSKSKIEDDFYEYKSMFKRCTHLLREDLLEATDIRSLDAYFFVIAYLCRRR